MKYGFPFVENGQAVGLFGGSFDPPHQGHLLVAERAIRRMGLDQLWWMPSPGNPLKARQPAPLETRMAQIRDLATHPKMRVTDIEARLGTRYSYDTISRLQAIYPNVKFVLVCGADILSEFHKWKNWQKLASEIAICAMARPDEQLKAGLSPFAQSFAPYRIEPEDVASLKTKNPPAWTILPGPTLPLSSSQIRAENGLK